MNLLVAHYSFINHCTASCAAAAGRMWAFFWGAGGLLQSFFRGKKANHCTASCAAAAAAAGRTQAWCGLGGGLDCRFRRSVGIRRHLIAVVLLTTCSRVRIRSCLQLLDILHRLRSFAHTLQHTRMLQHTAAAVAGGGWAAGDGS